MELDNIGRYGFSSENEDINILINHLEEIKEKNFVTPFIYYIIIFMLIFVVIFIILAFII